MAERFNELKPRYPKGSDGQTREKCTEGCKTIKEERLRLGQAQSITAAPVSRIYSRDYSKHDEDGDQGQDTLSVFLGNPLGF